VKFSKQLLDWWDQHGRKDLPWQHPRTAYRVWVSEIMLQQTQVKTVIPYFERFLQRFPDVQALATAAVDDVLALWSGLGYYARARNLHKAAGICVRDYGGELPDTPELLAGLPGIGASTANAIFSQAHDTPAVVLDGNVKRVLARYFAVDGWPGNSAVHKQLWEMAEQLLPRKRGADYTQAIMDLGAVLCTRSRPGCDRCPVADGCQARQNNAVDRYPAPRPRIRTSKKSFHMLILGDQRGRVLLERRPPAGIWGGLWCLPADDDGMPVAERLGLAEFDLQPLPILRHQLTHLRMEIQPLAGDTELSPGGVKCGPDLRWFERDEWPKAGLPKPVRQLLEEYFGEETHD
jgi:A/G-specific adenine glycosylase